MGGAGRRIAAGGRAVCFMPAGLSGCFSSASVLVRFLCNIASAPAASRQAGSDAESYTASPRLPVSSHLPAAHMGGACCLLCARAAQHRMPQIAFLHARRAAQSSVALLHAACCWAAPPVLPSVHTLPHTHWLLHVCKQDLHSKHSSPAACACKQAQQRVGALGPVWAAAAARVSMPTPLSQPP